MNSKKMETKNYTIKIKIDCIPEVHSFRLVGDLTTTGLFGNKPYNLFSRGLQQEPTSESDLIFNDEDFWQQLYQSFDTDLAYHTQEHLTDHEKKDLSSIVKNQCEIARDIWSKERAIVSQNAYDQIYVEGGRDSISQDPVLWNIPIDKVVSLDEDNPAYNVIRKSLEGNNANEDNGHFNNVRASFELQKRREIEWARKIQNHENSLVIVGYNHFTPKFGKFVPSLANKGLVINPVLDLSEQYNKTKNNNAEINRFQRLIGFRDSVAA